MPPPVQADGVSAGKHVRCTWRSSWLVVARLLCEARLAPAMTISCWLSDGLPIGLMLVAEQYDEAVIYRAAYVFEQSEDWRRM